jgi:hypothetical protein
MESVMGSKSLQRDVGDSAHSEKEKWAVASLAVAAVFSMMFLYGVSATNASFQGTAYPLSPAWNPANDIAPQLNATLAVVGENLGWSVRTAAPQLEAPVMAFLGIDSSSVEAESQPVTAPQLQSAVLGATHVGANYQPTTQ